MRHVCCVGGPSSRVQKERTEKLALLEELKVQQAKLQKELDVLKDNDPEVLKGYSA